MRNQKAEWDELVEPFDKWHRPAVRNAMAEQDSYALGLLCLIRSGNIKRRSGSHDPGAASAPRVRRGGCERLFRVPRRRRPDSQVHDLASAWLAG